MKKYNFIQALIASFYSRRFYQYVLYSRKGWMLMYLLSLIALFWLLRILVVQLTVNHVVVQKLPRFLDEIPVVKVIDGEVMIDKHFPYAVIDPATEDTVIIFEKHSGHSRLLNSSAQLMVTKTALYYKLARNDVRYLDLYLIDSFILNKQIIENQKGMLRWVFLAFYPLVFVFVFLLRFVLSVKWALMIMLIGRIKKHRLNFSASFRMAVAAVTPVVVLHFIHFLLPWKISYFSVIGTFVVLGYIVLMLKEER